MVLGGNFERAFTLTEFDPEAYRRKVEHASYGVCAVSYRNAKGEDVRAAGFLCVIRLPGRGNVFGIMTSSQALGITIFESFRFFVFDVTFSETLISLKQRHFTIAVHRDIDTWFVSDSKKLDVAFVELRPELQLAFVENGCHFLTLFEHRQIPLKGRKVLIWEDTGKFSPGTINETLKLDSELRCSRLGTIGSPIIDDVTFTVVGVAKFGDQFCKEVGSSIHAIVQSIIKDKLKAIPIYGPPRTSILSQEMTSIDMSKSRLGHIRDSVVIPFHLRAAICERLRRFLIMTAEDLVSCTDDQVKKVFPEDSLNHAVSKWQKAVAQNPDNDNPVQLQREKTKPEAHITLQACSAHRIASSIRDGSKTALPDCFIEPSYFANWGKRPKVKLAEAPAYIRAILAVPERYHDNSRSGRPSSPLIIVFAAGGHVIALPAYDFSAGIKWHIHVKMPEKEDLSKTNTVKEEEELEDGHVKEPADVEEPKRPVKEEEDVNVVHAVYDTLIDNFYITMGDGNIYRIRLSALKEVGRSKDKTCEKTIPLKLLIDSTQTEGRHFWGLAIDSGARLLFACDNGGAIKDVSIWRLPTPIDNNSKRRVMTSIEMVASLKSNFTPSFCSVFSPPKQQSQLLVKERSATNLSSNKQDEKKGDEVTLLLAVSDWRTSKIELFAGELVEDNDMVTPSVLRHVGIVAKRDSANPARPGYVSKPCEMVFDQQGNLIVADQLNYRITIFSPPSDCEIGNSGSRWLRNVWFSRSTGSVVERFALIRSPRTGRAALLTHTNYKTLIAFE